MDTPNGKPVILIRKLHKSFGNQTVLNGVDLEVAHGKTLMILGRSGMGKSVLLKLIIGLQKPDSGSIQVEGKEIVGLSMDQLNEIRKRIGFLFQNAALYDSLTVAENVAFPLKRHTEMSVAEQKDRVHELLSRVGMEEAGEKKPAEISGGMRKRVGLARALALNPEIMLSDEPTAGLDPITAGEINELIRELKQERQMSSIVVTHDMHSAKTVSDSVALLDKGDIVIQGTFDDLEKSNNPFVSEFLKQSF
jgi:phospholipid/cholesterol/gamma-HCH transport system ATP-binding protein